MGYRLFSEKRYAALWWMLTLLPLWVAATSPQEITAWTLAKIEATNLQRYSLEQVIAESGLKIGQRVSLNDINAAAERLRQSGLFVKAGYSYRYVDDKMDLTFTTEEEKWELPVVFDNFIWFGDEELNREIAREVPTYDGKAPRSGGVITRISKALDRALRERNLAAEVAYTPSYDADARQEKEHIFSVKGVNLTVCAVSFPDAARAVESELQKRAKPLLNNPFSKGFAVEFTRANLLPMYRERGHLRVQLRGIQAQQDASTACKGGVALALLFDEGLAYNLNGVEWTGAATLTGKELEATLAMKTGDIANGVKFDNGLQAIRAIYGKRGFIRATLTPAAVFDDAARQVSYQIAVSEGAQYRMGNLQIIGMADKDAEKVRKKWKLKPGDIYDASLISEFLKTGLGEQWASRVTDAKLKTDAQKLSVDIILSFR